MCGSTTAVELDLPLSTKAPALARAHLSLLACPEHHAGILETARLLVSELVSNAVRHGAAPVTARVECDAASGILVRVHDGGPVTPALRRPPEIPGGAAPGGRGLALVDLLADAWGVEPDDRGKDVWFLVRPGRGLAGRASGSADRPGPT